MIPHEGLTVGWPETVISRQGIEGTSRKALDAAGIRGPFVRLPTQPNDE